MRPEEGHEQSLTAWLEQAGIHSLFHGGTVYVVGRGATILKTGDYRQEHGRWVLK